MAVIPRFPSLTLHVPFTFGPFSIITQKKVRHFVKRYCNNIDIKLVFSSFKIGNLFSVKDPVPRGHRAGVVYNISFCVRAVMPAMSAKPPGIFPRAYVSTFSVTGPLTSLNTYKILSIAALRALLTVSAS